MNYNFPDRFSCKQKRRQRQHGRETELPAGPRPGRPTRVRRRVRARPGAGRQPVGLDPAGEIVQQADRQAAAACHQHYSLGMFVYLVNFHTKAKER